LDALIAEPRPDPAIALAMERRLDQDASDVVANTLSSETQVRRITWTVTTLRQFAEII
jgi:hypothetical protein